MGYRVMWVSLLGTLLAGPVLAQECDSSKEATAAMSRFKDKGSVLVDKKSKRVWLRCALGMTWNGSTCEGKTLTYTWDGAEEAIAELNDKRVGERRNWRLPTLEELQDIVEPRCYKPAVDLEVFPYSPESGFWTATKVEGVNPRAWIIHFLHGQAYLTNRQQAWRVRPIADQ